MYAKYLFIYRGEGKCESFILTFFNKKCLPEIHDGFEKKNETIPF